MTGFYPPTLIFYFNLDLFSTKWFSSFFPTLVSHHEEGRTLALLEPFVGGWPVLDCTVEAANEQLVRLDLFFLNSGWGKIQFVA